MTYLSKRMSLASFFSWFSVILLGAAVLISFGFWTQIYRSELEQKQIRLASDADRIDAVMTDSFDYTAKYIEFIGEKIALQNTNDLNYIANFIGGNYITRPQEQNLYITTTFDWVTPDKMLRVSSKVGVLPTPFDMSDRDYLTQTKVQPWTLQLSEPRFGGLSKQWIIPAGMGITNKQGKFIGSITLGFALDGLTRRIIQVVGNSDLRFIILTSRGELVLDSKRENAAPAESPLKVPQELLVANPRYLDTPLEYDGTNLSYIKPVGKYPFVILTGYPVTMPAALFSSMVLSRLASFSGIAAAAFLMLYLLRRRIVKPVIQLAAAADRISKGMPAMLPQSHMQEIALLSEQLQKVSDYVQNEHRISKELTYKTQLLEISTHKLEMANAEALAAAEAARKADVAKSEFLANMSHELRTPMNAVIGLTSILLSKEHTPEKRNQFLQVMQTSAHHLMQLINDLLDIAKLESGQTLLEAIAFDLNKTVHDVVDMNRVQAKQKNIDLKLNITSPPPPELIGDPHRLQQILINLLGNAIKFTDKGGVTLELDCRANPVTRQWNVTIAVADTGIGIPANKLGTIFDKFTQADSSINRTHGGTGLGLSICKTLTEMMSGKIRVESTYGKGSRFVIEFPLASPAGPAMAANNDKPIQDLSVEKAKVLLVEDHSANILMTTALLDMYGYSYETARSGDEALVKLQNAVFDVVLMDVQMPVMSGIEVTRIIRINEKTSNAPRIPIIGLTAHALITDRDECLQAGMDEYITKPFDPDQLLETIKCYLVNKRRASIHLEVA